MKNIYEKVELEIILFDSDVVRTSSNDNVVDFPELPEEI